MILKHHEHTSFDSDLEQLLDTLSKQHTMHDHQLYTSSNRAEYERSSYLCWKRAFKTLSIVATKDLYNVV